MRLAGHCSQLAHLLVLGAFGLCVVVSVAASLVAWRLSQGPVDVSWLSNRARTALLDKSGPVQLSFAHASLASGGPSGRLDHLLELLVSEARVTARNGTVLAAAPQARMTFSIPALLAGRFVPRTLAIDGARISVPPDMLQAGGSPAPDLRRIARSFVEQADSRAGLLSRMAWVRVRRATIVLPPPGDAPRPAASALDLDIIRDRPGHLHGSMTTALVAADQHSALRLTFDLASGGDSRLTLSASAFRPGNASRAFERSVPIPGFVAGLDIPVSISAALRLDAAFDLRSAEVKLQAGSGHVALGDGSVPVRGAILDLLAAPDGIGITRASLDIMPDRGKATAHVGVGGSLHAQADRLVAALDVTLDNLDIADLPGIWPPGVGGDARSWIVRNVIGGQATHGTGSFVLQSDGSLRHVTLTKATADLDARNATFTWLDGIPPIDRAAVHLRLIDPDTLDILLPSGHQHVGGSNPDLLAANGVLRIAGLSAPNQSADIRTQVEGPVTSVLALLGQPRLHLLSAHPLNVAIDSGSADATLRFQFPLVSDLRIDDVALHGHARLAGVRMPQVVGTATLTGGAFTLDVTKDLLRADGTGMVTAVPVKLQGMMDFTDGPANQVARKLVVAGRPEAADLRQFGTDIGGFIDGPVPSTVTLATRRNGIETVTLDGDLTEASLSAPPLAWTKPPGAPASLTAALSLKQGRLAAVDHFAASGDGLSVVGSARAADGVISFVALDRMQLGRTQAHGSVRVAKGEPLDIVVDADMIDLTGTLAGKRADNPVRDVKPPGDPAQGAEPPFDASRTVQPAPAPPATAPPWRLNARINRVLLANDVQGADLSIKAGGGDSVQSLDAGGTVQHGAAVSARIDRADAGRHLRIETQDAGTLLRGLNLARQMRSGRLVLDGTFPDPSANQPLVGTIAIDNVTLMHSPAAAKVLQGLTIYGLGEALRGPGMRFAHVNIPFEYRSGAIRVSNARAYNASLGLTAEGTISTHAGRIDIDGTIVPAYALNSMLGELPVFGRLFSPEAGGGLFAARYNVSGPLDDPRVSINPISALAPGVLRSLFGSKQRPAPPGNAATEMQQQAAQ